MAVVQTLIGNIKGPAGNTGPTGATGAQGPAATIEVGTVSTAAYGTPAEVTNSGSSSEAVFDFIIPEGAPGESVTDMSGLTLNTITTSSASYPTISAGDIGRVIAGKINKFFGDIRSAVNALTDRLNTSPTIISFNTGSSVTMATNYSVWSPISKTGQIFAIISVGSSQPSIPLTITTSGSSWAGGGIALKYAADTGIDTGYRRFDVGSDGKLTMAGSGLPQGNYIIVGTARCS